MKTPKILSDSLNKLNHCRLYEDSGTAEVHFQGPDRKFAVWRCDFSTHFIRSKKLSFDSNKLVYAHDGTQLSAEQCELALDTQNHSLIYTSNGRKKIRKLNLLGFVELEAAFSELSKNSCGVIDWIPRSLHSNPILSQPQKFERMGELMMFPDHPVSGEVMLRPSKTDIQFDLVLDSSTLSWKSLLTSEFCRGAKLTRSIHYNNVRINY